MVSGGAVTEQEQAPFDLAEGERLLAAYKQEAADPDDVSFDAHRRMHRVRHAWLTWLVDNGEALVTVLKADRKDIEGLQFRLRRYLEGDSRGRLVAELEERVGKQEVELFVERDQNAKLRDDLARVERQAETDNEWLQARIAELETERDRYKDMAMNRSEIGIARSQEIAKLREGRAGGNY